VARQDPALVAWPEPAVGLTVGVEPLLLLSLSEVSDPVEPELDEPVELDELDGDTVVLLVCSAFVSA
jgi:hypothetical protein